MMLSMQKPGAWYRVPAATPVYRRQAERYGQVPGRSQRPQQADDWRVPRRSSDTVPCTGAQVTTAQATLQQLSALLLIYIG